MHARTLIPTNAVPLSQRFLRARFPSRAASPALLALACGASFMNASRFPVLAQEPTPQEPVAESPPTPPDASPEAGAASGVAPVEEALGTVADLGEAPGEGRARFEAGRVKYAGQVAIVEADEGEFVSVRSGTARIQARRIEIDLEKRTLRARGEVVVERRTIANREIYMPDRADQGDVMGPDTGIRFDLGREEAGQTIRPEPFTERVKGEDLFFDGATQVGSIDNALLQLVAFDVSSARIDIRSRRYTAQGVVLRPGGLTEEEKRIYGTPPFTLRARRISVSRTGTGGGRVTARGAALYFKSTRLLPIPSVIFSSFGRIGPSRSVATYRAVPRFSFNSTDGLIATALVSFPLSGFPDADEGASASDNAAARAGTNRRSATTTVLNADLGLSQKIGFRGGASLENRSPLGLVSLRARRADIITTQLTSRIQLDRKPELSLDTPILSLARPKGSVGLGAYLSASAGRFTERFVGLSPTVSSSRYAATAVLTTRVANTDGPYLDLFHSNARYPTLDARYKNTGFEAGYVGQVLPRVRGLFSYRHSSISGATPFRFDLIEIPRELRATFDYQLSPRYMLPFDLRYDVSQKKLRDKTFGILRSYKTFAYGVVYQSARSDLRLEFRTNF
jgi:hypothetical protein